MPAPPKLADIRGQIGPGKVFHHLQAKETGGSDGDVAIAGKIKVDLKGIAKHCQKRNAGMIFTGILPDTRDKKAKPIRNHQFFEESDGDALASDLEISSLEGNPGILKLGVQPFKTLNRSCQKDGKQAVVEQEICKAARLHQFPFDIGEIADLFEGDIADTQRQEQMMQTEVGQGLQEDV